MKFGIKNLISVLSKITWSNFFFAIFSQVLSYTTSVQTKNQEIFKKKSSEKNLFFFRNKNTKPIKKIKKHLYINKVTCGLDYFNHIQEPAELSIKYNLNENKMIIVDRNSIFFFGSYRNLKKIKNPDTILIIKLHSDTINLYSFKNKYIFSVFFFRFENCRLWEKNNILLKIKFIIQIFPEAYCNNKFINLYNIYKFITACPLFLYRFDIKLKTYRTSYRQI